MLVGSGFEQQLARVRVLLLCGPVKSELAVFVDEVDVSLVGDEDFGGRVVTIHSSKHERRPASMFALFVDVGTKPNTLQKLLQPAAVRGDVCGDDNIALLVCLHTDETIDHTRKKTRTTTDRNWLASRVEHLHRHQTACNAKKNKANLSPCLNESCQIFVAVLCRELSSRTSAVFVMQPFVSTSLQQNFTDFSLASHGGAAEDRVRVLGVGVSLERDEQLNHGGVATIHCDRQRGLSNRASLVGVHAQADELLDVLPISTLGCVDNITRFILRRTRM